MARLREQLHLLHEGLVRGSADAERAPVDTLQPDPEQEGPHFLRLLPRGRLLERRIELRAHLCGARRGVGGTATGIPGTQEMGAG